MRRRTAVALMGGLALCGGLLARSRAAGPHHAVPASKDGNLVVGLCDGETSAEVPGVKEGGTPSRAQAQEVSDRLMAEWRRKNREARWDDGAVEVAQVPPVREPPPGGVPAPGGARSGTSIEGGQGAAGATQEGQTYGAFSARDEAIWKAATDRFVAEGDKIFHSAELLGGTIAVSCDMCHPNAANTHPETYPKFQVQFGRVALLRDMINWCIENPVRGKPLPDDDPKLKALEAYILAQRKGVALEYGKH